MFYNKFGCNWFIDLLKMYVIDVIVKRKLVLMNLMIMMYKYY